MPACELVTDPDARRDADRLAASVRDTFPVGIAPPALRALTGAGYTNLDALGIVSEAGVASLHGMGPKAMGLLRQALHATGRTSRS